MDSQLALHMFTVGAVSTNCYVVSKGSDALVIDPGHGAGAQVKALVEENGLTVDKVLLTHGHLDHTRDCGEVAQACGASVYIHQADHFMLADAKKEFLSLDMILDQAHMIQPKDVVYYGSEADSFGTTSDTNEAVVGWSTIVPTALGEVTVLGAPGHSPGSVLLLLDGICFSGDVLFAGSIGRTDLPRSNPHSMLSSLSDVVAKLPDDTPVLPGHGPQTTIKTEKATNQFLRGLA